MEIPKKKFDLSSFRERYPGAYAKWTPEDDQLLRTLYEAGANTPLVRFVAEMALRFERNPGAIRARLKKLLPEKFGEPEPKKEKIKPKPTSGPVFTNSLEKFAHNPEAMQVLKALEEGGTHIFLTGRAGTGKSTLLDSFRATTDKNIAVLAPTGMAALNVKGQTIHSFCRFPADIVLERVKKLKPWTETAKLLKKLNTIIIDEVSMVRADLLDCLDRFLRLNGNFPSEPFGGYHMVFIGDLYQLPPVESSPMPQNEDLFFEYQSPYFFDAQSFKQVSVQMHELQHVYRQEDEDFLQLLNRIRDNSADITHLHKLNQRVVPQGFTESSQLALTLCTTNAQASLINSIHLQKLHSTDKKFVAQLEGDFPEKLQPTDRELVLRSGAQVMLLNNDQQGRWVNGSMGKVTGFARQSNGQDGVLVQLENGAEHVVLPHAWNMYTYAFDENTDKVEQQTVGSFKQYPLKLAWAITIHKSQGQTFNRVHVDLGRGTFAHGQLYVALSRCRSLDGLSLERPVKLGDVKLDDRVTEFFDKTE